jgi:hypothetical protein
MYFCALPERFCNFIHRIFEFVKTSGKCRNVKSNEIKTLKTLDG